MKLATNILLAWVILGSFYLIYVQQIDGHYINIPISFQVDTQNLQIERPVYHSGDTIRTLFSFCRYRNYTTKSTWKLVNEIVITYPETSTVLKPECVTNRWITIGVIPPDAIPGAHHLEGVTQIQLNPLNSVYINYKSEEFQVN